MYSLNLHIIKGKLLFLLFCISLLTSVWTVNIYCIVGFSLLCLILLFNAKNLSFTTILVVLYSLLYAIISYCQDTYNSGFAFVSYLISPLAYYCYGQFVAEKCNSSEKLIRFFCITIFFFSIIINISNLTDIIDYGIVKLTRNIEHIIGGTSTFSATLIGLNVSLGYSTLPFILFNRNKNKLQTTIFIITITLSLLTVLHLVNRTGIIITILCLFFAAIYNSKNNTKKYLIAIFIFLVFGLILFNTSIGHTISDAYVFRSETEDSIASGNGRTDRWLDAIGKLFLYPFGWYENTFTYHEYVHNLWLDIARVVGIFPFIIIVALTIMSFVKTYKLIHIRQSGLITLILSLQICFFASSFVEPVIDALPQYFYLYIMLWGIQDKLYYKIKNNHFIL